MSGGLEHEAVQQTLLGDAAEHAEVGVVVWNEERRYVAVNVRACEILGVTRGQLLGGKVGTTNRDAQAQRTIDDLLRKVPARGTTPFSRDGATIQLDWVVFPTSLAGLPHIVGLMWDAVDLS